MAFPVISNTANTITDGLDHTSKAVNLPANIVSGNLLIITGRLWKSGTAPGTPSWPSGWTEIFHSSSSNTLGMILAGYRIADGTEGSTATVSWGSAVRNTWRSLRITNNHASAAPEAQFGNDTGTSATADPPAVTPSWGSADTLWWASVFRTIDATFTSYPTNYADNQYRAENDATDWLQATRNLAASTEDPGVFTWVGNNAAKTMATIAIRPVPAGFNSGFIIG